MYIYLYYNNIYFAYHNIHIKVLIVIQNIVCSDITLFYKNILVSVKCLTQCGSKIKCIHKIFYMYWLRNMNQNKLPIILQPLKFNFYLS